MNQKNLSLSVSLLGCQFREPGKIRASDDEIWLAYEFFPLPSGRFESELRGPKSESFFAKLTELLSKFPSHTKFDLFFVRSYASIATNTLFATTGLVTRIYLIEKSKPGVNRGVVAESLKELGLEAEPLADTGFDFLVSRLHGKREASKIIPDVVWERDHLKAGANFVKIVSLTELPQASWAGCFQNLFEFPAEFVVSIKAEVPDKAKIKRTFETRRRVSHALSVQSSLELKNIESNSTLGASEEVLERLTISKESLLNISMAVIVAERNLERAREIASAIAREAAGVANAGLFIEGVGALPVFKSQLPTSPMQALRTLPVLSGNLAHMLPLVLDYSRVQDPSHLRLHSRNGEISYLNVFSGGNLSFHAFLAGASGSGKSFLMNSMIAAFKADNPHGKVAVFDVGGSYRKLVSHLGGTTVGLDAVRATALISSFLARHNLENSGLCRTLVETFCGSGPHLTHSHTVAIENLLTELEGAAFRIHTLIDACKGRAERVYADIAHWLKPHLKFDSAKQEDFSAVFDGQASAFDFKGLDADPLLQRLAILVLLQNIWSQIAADKSQHRTLIVFDEVWKFFAHAAKHLEEMYRTLRKNRAGIVSLTQNLGDYGDAGFARLVVTNSYSRILLQNGADAKHLKLLLDLDDSDIERALSVHSKKPEYSEFLLHTPDFSQIYRLLATPDLYQLANSENLQVKA